ncbi:MAG TPA: neutral zinc metallopeptidase [Nonomuraea sp.]|nr:neutral zinc metallopeptidase [Nonomuraea sp.]
MRRLPIKRFPVLVAAVVAVSCVPAPAAAAPAPFPRGRLAVSSCPEPPISSGGIPRTREYLQAVMKCLNKSWKAYVSRGKRAYRAPVVRYHEEPPATVCGVPWPERAAAVYCPARRTLDFPLPGSEFASRTDLYLFKVAAHEYGHHVQRLLGIRHPYETRPGHQELGLRYELQADCLAGVFVGSVWRSLKRGRADWEALVDLTRAGGDGEYRSHGTGASRVRWLTRGYRTVSPAACDTWSAPAAEVA